MSVNDITGDKIATKAATEKYRSGWEGIQWVTPKFDSTAKCSPMLTQCPRCNNPHNACDQDFSGQSPEYLARSRAVIATYWDDMPEMWRRLYELEAEYKS